MKRNQSSKMIFIVSEAIKCPVTSLLILLSIAVFAFVSRTPSIERFCSFSYHDIVEKCQYDRVLTSTFMSGNLVHLIFNVSSLWSGRVIEKAVGNLFFFKYTIVFIFTSSLLLIIFIRLLKWIMTWRGIISNFDHRLASFEDVPVNGATGVIFAWLAYNSLSSGPTHVPILFVCAIIPARSELAPLMLAIAGQLLLTKPGQFSTSSYFISGALSGYLLLLGILAIFSNTFWTVCLLLDCLLVVGVAHAKRGFGSGSETNLWGLPNYPEVELSGELTEPMSIDSTDASNTSSDLRAEVGVGSGSRGSESESNSYGSTGFFSFSSWFGNRAAPAGTDLPDEEQGLIAGMEE